MSSAVLVDNPVPVFAHYLERLQHLLAKVEQSQDQSSAILSARLAPEMLPFANQVRAAARFALRGAFPLFGKQVPAAPEDAPSLPGLQREVAEVRQWMLALPQTGRITQSRETLAETAGFARVELPADEFLSRYLLPNFFFHLSMVYAIARQQGVPLGKGDFDGYQQYPTGNTFE